MRALWHQINDGKSEERENDRKAEKRKTTPAVTWLEMSSCVHCFVSSHLGLSQTRAQLTQPGPQAGRPGSTLTFKYPLN